MEEEEGLVQGRSDDESMNKSMNGNNLAVPGSNQTENTIIKRRRQNSVSSMDGFSVGEYKPPVPARRSVRKHHDTIAGERELWKRWMQNMEDDMEQYKQKAEKLHMLYERQKNICEARTDDLMSMESKVVQLEKQCTTQENLIVQMNHEHAKMSEELKDRSKKLAETVNELSLVMQRSEELAKRLHEFERQLQASETARNMELENLRSLQGSFQASEKHFASVLEQVQSLILENEMAYETNCKLNQEKIKVERDLSFKNRMSTSLTAELAEAQEKMRQINNTLKAFENEKTFLYKKVQDLRSLISRLENELEEKNKQLEAATQAKTDLEGQLKLANLCLSRALSGKDKANIFPQKSEVKMVEAATSNGALLPSVRVLQEEINAKDKIIGRLIEENNSLEDELRKCEMELLKQQEVNSASQIWFTNLTGAPSDLDHEIRQRERIIDSMKLTIEKAISERNRLGLKCMRRKEQANLLKEKNKVLEEIMLIGNRLYEEGLKKIRNMKMAQENPFGSTLSLVGIVNGNSRPGTPSCRQIMMRGNSEGITSTNAAGDEHHHSCDSYDSDMVMNI